LGIRKGFSTIVLSFSLLLLVMGSALGVESTAGLYAPVGGTVTSNFGWRTDPFNSSHRFHSGIDIAAPSGSPIYVPQNGVVVFAGNYGGYGNVVVVDHGYQLYTLYGHTSTYYVRAGQTVSRGQAIAAVGSTGRSTGPHLHFEVHQKRQYVNPMNYLAYLQNHVPLEPNAPVPEEHNMDPIAIAVSNGSSASGVESAGISVGVGSGVGGVDLDEGSGNISNGTNVTIGPPVPKGKKRTVSLLRKRSGKSIEIMQGDRTSLVKF